MDKGYLLMHGVNTDDFLKIEEMVRKSKCLIATPSNITDLYDSEAYRKASLNGTKLKATLDNNVFTLALSLVDGSKEKGASLSDEQKIVCGIMCFLIHSGIENIPTGVLERPTNSYFGSKETQDYLFRVADHIHPQVYADLALERYSDVPEEQFLSAKKEVDSNPQTQKDISKTTYPADDNVPYQLIYMNLLKSWLLYKEEITQEEMLEKYLSWHFSNSLADQVSTIFVIMFLSGKRLPKMIKNLNSTSPEVIVKNIKNATWDLFYLALLEKLHTDTGSEEIYFFCTRDAPLLAISKFLFKHSSIEKVRNFTSDFYNESAADIAENYIMEVRDRPNRDEHSKRVIKNLPPTIKELEGEVSLVLQQL